MQQHVIQPSPPLNASTCCTCFGPFRTEWNDTSSGQMSDVYCRPCDKNIDSPSCLNHIANKHLNAYDSACRQTILTVESELELLNKEKRQQQQQHQPNENVEKKCLTSSIKKSQKQKIITPKKLKNNNKSVDNSININEEFELANDATVCNNLNIDDIVQLISRNENDCMIRVQGEEELPASLNEQILLKQYCDDKLAMDQLNQLTNKNCKQLSKKIVCNDSHPLLEIDKKCNVDKSNDNLNGNDRRKVIDDHNDNDDGGGNGDCDDDKFKKPIYSTLPRVKKTSIIQYTNLQKRSLNKIPTRLTPDGTTIYYWCDLSKQMIKGYLCCCLNYFLPLYSHYIRN